MQAIFLSGLARFAPWILAGLPVFGGVIYLRHEQAMLRMANADLVAIKAENVRLQAANSENVARLQRLQKDDAAWQSALAMTMQTDDRDTGIADTVLNGIATAPAGRDGPVAPVLAETLAALAGTQDGSR